MRVTGVSEDGSRATVLRGWFRLRIAELRLVDDHSTVQCNGRSCLYNKHITRWVYDVTGRPIDWRVVHALQRWVTKEAAAAEEAASNRDWTKQSRLPRARLLLK